MAQNRRLKGQTVDKPVETVDKRQILWPICVMNTRETGGIGENVACKYLENKGFEVVVRNYQKRWGEIDIIGQKDKVLHFFEVKSVYGVSNRFLDAHKPEDNVHGLKIRHIRRMIETFLAETGRDYETEFHFHVLSVYMNTSTRRARIRWLKDIIL